MSWPPSPPRQLAYFEVPTQWQIQYQALPQNATGKILKRQLRDDWLAGAGRARAGGPRVTGPRAPR